MSQYWNSRLYSLFISEGFSALFGPITIKIFRSTRYQILLGGLRQHRMKSRHFCLYDSRNRARDHRIFRSRIALSLFEGTKLGYALCFTQYCLWCVIEHCYMELAP